MEKPVATLSIDLDNCWTYLRANGDPSWQDYPSFLDAAIPRAIDTFSLLNIPATFFIVGRDIERPELADYLSGLTTNGHEVGNHSYNHPINLHRLNEASVLEEIQSTEMAIERVCGVRPFGFRGPSYRLSRTILQILSDRQYRYDASTFPTSIGPLARSFHFQKAKLSEAEKEAAKDLFGGFKDALQPLNEYIWPVGNTKIIEIPVSTLPLLRLPIHFTYFNFLADQSMVVAKLYLRFALKLFQIRNLKPSILLHATDFIGKDDHNCPIFLPGMKRTAAEKVGLLREMLSYISDGYQTVSIADYVSTINMREIGDRKIESLMGETR